VRRIFTEYVAGRGIFAIAEALTRDDIPSPSAHDRGQNPHRSGIAWSKGAIRTILANPRYTGRQVWNKQRKDEVLIDVDDVALGHVSKLRRNDPGKWVWSDDVVHEPLIDTGTFERAQHVMAAKGAGRNTRELHRTRHRYVLRGLLYCGLWPADARPAEQRSAVLPAAGGAAKSCGTSDCRGSTALTSRRLLEPGETPRQGRGAGAARGDRYPRREPDLRYRGRVRPHERRRAGNSSPSTGHGSGPDRNGEALD
jgi:hypothetical protein